MFINRLAPRGQRFGPRAITLAKIDGRTVSHHYGLAQLMADVGTLWAGPRILDLLDGPSVDVAKLAAPNDPNLDTREHLAFGADSSFRKCGLGRACGLVVAVPGAAECIMSWQIQDWGMR
jgi:hypothetical protein